MTLDHKLLSIAPPKDGKVPTREQLVNEKELESPIPFYSLAVFEVLDSRCV